MCATQRPEVLMIWRCWWPTTSSLCSGAFILPKVSLCGSACFCSCNWEMLESGAVANSGFLFSIFFNYAANIENARDFV